MWDIPGNKYGKAWAKTIGYIVGYIWPKYGIYWAKIMEYIMGYIC